MLLVHADVAADGEVALRVDRHRLEEAEGVPLAGDELVEAVSDLVWSASAVSLLEDVDAVKVSTKSPLRFRVDVGWANLLMLLSDVRGRRFRRGIFIGDELLALADQFRAAAGVVAAGGYLPAIEVTGGVHAARWRPVEPRGAFFDRCVDELARRAGRTLLETALGPETVEDAWLAALRSDDPRLIAQLRSRGGAAFGERDFAELAERLAEWTASMAVSAEDRAALTISLEAPKTQNGSWRLCYQPPVTRLALVALGQAIRIFPPLGAEVFRREDAEAFLRTGARELAAAGFSVVLPPGMVGEHVSAEVELEPDADVPPPKSAGERRSVNTRLVIHVDGEVVSEAEIEFLLDQNSSMVFFRNRWIEVNRAILKEALKALRSVKGRRLNTREAVAMCFGTRRLGSLRIAKARAHGWLRGIVNELKGGEGFHTLPAPSQLKGELRDYQLRGYSWIDFLVRLGFGPCLADDMGLGKTVQTIAWVLARRQRPVLVVSPVSVTTNWAREFARFAPGLRVLLHQGPTRALGGTFAVACRRADVVITGYSLLVRDFRDLQAVAFSALVLDEAQTIKNPDTRVSKAARALNVPVRVALTGTPLENSALDLWSIEEFLNPGLLGERRDFVEAYVRDLSASSAVAGASAAAAKLRHTLAPFMLRRLKSDPEIAAELGAKREIREYCALSPEQRRAYEDALRHFHEEAAEPASNSRHGRMLALLTELKLVCDGEGKLARLDELLEEIFAAGESALVFTQYVTVAKRIREHLAESFGRRFPFLHGGLSAVAREGEIAAFNEDPQPNAFLISLKAGGFGLNLTRATHVIHFDRWWNPAVENQATDRAHRIGQNRTVFVHLFICAGTLEDRIDAILEDKRRLAGDVIASGEAFLAKMSEVEFERTVALE